MEKRKLFIYLHMSTRAILTLSVIVAISSFVLFTLISNGIIVPPATQEEVHIAAAINSSSTDSRSSVDDDSTAQMPYQASSDEATEESAEDLSGSMVLLSEYATLALGDDNISVHRLTQRLVSLGYLDQPSSEYNKSVQTGVSMFQRVCGMEITGIADAELQALLFSDAAQSYRIQLGDSGDDVSSAQQRLKDLGYYSGRSTGFYGPQTRDSVILFEYHNGLKRDGVLSITDLKQLYCKAAGHNLITDLDFDISSLEDSLIYDSGFGYPHMPDGLHQAATDQLGKPYVWNSKGPDSFDSSGLIQYCLKLCGISINQKESADYADIPGWMCIDEQTDLYVGDLVFFKNDSGTDIAQIGIYIGNNNFVHASSSSGKVVADSLSEPYWARNYLFGRRVFND